MDAIVLKRGGSGLSLIHVWKQYNVNTATTYTWDKYTVQTTYTVEVTGSVSGRIKERAKPFTSYTQSGIKFMVTGDRVFGTNALGAYTQDTLGNIYGSVWLDKIYKITYVNPQWYNDSEDGGNPQIIHSCTFDTIEGRAVESTGIYQSQVVSSSSSAYPNPGKHTDGYWYQNRTSNTIQSQGTFKQNVYSTNPNLYPHNGISNGFWYVYDGTISG